MRDLSRPCRLGIRQRFNRDVVNAIDGRVPARVRGTVVFFKHCATKKACWAQLVNVHGERGNLQYVVTVCRAGELLDHAKFSERRYTSAIHEIIGEAFG